MQPKYAECDGGIMLVNIIKTPIYKKKEKSVKWEEAVATILSATETISNKGKTKITYIKDYGEFVVEVSVLRSINDFYVMEASKNGKLQV